MPSRRNRRWNKSFFLNMGLTLVLGLISSFIGGLQGLGLAVLGYVCGGVVILFASAEARSHEITDQREQFEELMRELSARDPE